MRCWAHGHSLPYRLAGVLVVVGACKFTTPAATDARGDDPDAPVVTEDVLTVDAGPADAFVPPDAQRCFGTVNPICLTQLPTQPRDFLTPTAINTDTSLLCETTDQPELCVVTGTSMMVASKLTGVGSKPLVLLATTGAIIVSAELTVASGGGIIGAGAGGPCAAGQNPITGGGGQGGSFGGKGGNGGDRTTNDHGVAGAVTALGTTLRGGCAGAAGAGADEGAGGSGGGAVALIAPTITVSGLINAGGAGGRGATENSSGGGGGGSGGTILLDTLDFTNSGLLLANGGGGGEGSGSSTAGASGADSTANARASGGGGLTGNGNDGGDGSLGAAGQSGDSGVAGGGGGGGGGAGVIRTTDPTPAQNAIVSPALS